MIRFPARAVFTAMLCCIAATAVRAQGATAPDTSTVDHIVAIVGSKAILSSQLLEEVYARASGGADHIPQPSKDSVGYHKALRRYVDTLVAFELLRQEAEADTTIKVTDQEVEQAADQIVNNARKQFATEVEFRDQLKAIGFANSDEWRASLLDRQRGSLEVSRLRQELVDDGKIKSLTPTDKEMRAYYAAHIGELPPSPPSISFRQIVVAPKPTPAAKARALALADSLVIELRKGADFATTARRFSMDEKSRADGGNLDWFPHGLMVPEFEAVAFSLPVGTISDPVESPFGYHIIQVQRKQPGEVQARHILIMPVVDSAGAKAAHDQAEAIAAALAKGASFDSLQHMYHDAAEDKELNDYPIPNMESDPAGKPYIAAIAGLDSGQVSKVFELPAAGQPLRSKWAVLEVLRRRPEGARPYDDLKDQLRKMLGTMMGEQDYITQLRNKTYVDIREP
ncbi:MAG TPA: peptidylprolyl isomerase [Gemmatimonadales bacterium]